MLAAQDSFERTSLLHSSVVGTGGFVDEEDSVMVHWVVEAERFDLQEPPEVLVP